MIAEVFLKKTTVKNFVNLADKVAEPLLMKM